VLREVLGLAIYLYRCADDGVFEVNVPMGSAGDTAPCPECHSGSRRTYSAPMLGRARGPAARVIERAERTRDVPDVVAAPPPRARPRPATASRNPMLKRLPRS
jgi:hypothetical protein